MGLLDGRVALITAAAGAGIGAATARRFAEEGATVVLTDAHARRVEEAAEHLGRDFGREFVALTVDVSDRAQVDQMVQTALDRHGRIDILVNNAARNMMAPVAEITDEIWQTVIGVCLTGTFYCTRAVLPHMLKQGDGRIVNMSSVAGWGGAANQAAYAAAKAGVMALTRAAAAETAKQGIRINAVAPSFSPNPFLERIYPKAMLEELERRAIFGRGAEPVEIANVILFLASDLSSYMTGEVLSVSNQHA